METGEGLVAPDESEAVGVKVGAGLVVSDESEAAGVAVGLSGIGVAEAEERDSSCSSYSFSLGIYIALTAFAAVSGAEWIAGSLDRDINGIAILCIKGYHDRKGFSCGNCDGV